MSNLLIPRTVADLRRAMRDQLSIGVYEPTPRELPPLTWVWTSVYTAETKFEYVRVLGVILDIRKWRHQGNMQREYTVLTTMGQFVRSRERLMLASLDEVRAEEGLTAKQDLKEAIYSAIEDGPSEANTLRYIRAAAAMIDLGERIVYVPYVRSSPCQCSSCAKRVDVYTVPQAVLTGSW